MFTTMIDIQSAAGSGHPAIAIAAVGVTGLSYPIVALDVLGEAVDRTQFIWLTQLDQNSATLSMSGTSTSVNAVADFVTNLENTRFFRNVEVANVNAAPAGTFSFSLKCDFAPPSSAPVAAPPIGGN